MKLLIDPPLINHFDSVLIHLKIISGADYLSIFDNEDTTPNMFQKLNNLFMKHNLDTGQLLGLLGRWVIHEKNKV